jgi:hypothetical protein
METSEKIAQVDGRPAYHLFHRIRGNYHLSFIHGLYPGPFRRTLITWKLLGGMFMSNADHGDIERAFANVQELLSKAIGTSSDIEEQAKLEINQAKSIAFTDEDEF